MMRKSAIAHACRADVPWDIRGAEVEVSMVAAAPDFGARADAVATNHELATMMMTSKRVEHRAYGDAEARALDDTL